MIEEKVDCLYEIAETHQETLRAMAIAFRQMQERIEALEGKSNDTE